MITQDDRQFLEAFEQCVLGSKCWTHEAHVRIGYSSIVLASTEAREAFIEPDIQPL